MYKRGKHAQSKYIKKKISNLNLNVFGMGWNAKTQQLKTRSFNKCTSFYEKRPVPRCESIASGSFLSYIAQHRSITVFNVTDSRKIYFLSY